MIAWFITPYESDVNAKPIPRRWCAMDKYTSLIDGDGGKWEEIEVGANRAIVKVKATPPTLGTIGNEFTRIPVSLLGDSLSSLTDIQKTRLIDKVKEMGYTLSEIQSVLGNDIGQRTLRDLLRFITTRRIPPRFDSETQTIVFDLPPVACSKQLNDVDERIQ